MSLNRNQKNHLTALFAIIFILCLGAAIGYGIWWSGETDAVTHFCSGTTGVTVTSTHADGQSTSYLLNDPKCH